jgi:hypothetical protein
LKPHTNFLSWIVLVLATAIILLSLIWAIFWARKYSGFTQYRAFPSCPTTFVVA